MSLVFGGKAHSGKFSQKSSKYYFYDSSHWKCYQISISDIKKENMVKNEEKLKKIKKKNWPTLARLLEILEGWILSIPTVASSDSNHPSWSHQRCLPLKRKAVGDNTYLFWITPLATLLFRNHATFCTTLQAAADFFKTKQFKKIKKLPNKICYQIYS